MSVIKHVLSSVMSLDVTTLLVFILVLLITYIVVKQMTGPKLPPGPPSLPIIGGALFLNHPGRVGVTDARRLVKKYNSDIVSVNMFGNLFVLLESHQFVKEAFQKRDDMANRPVTSFFKSMDPAHEGILASSGSVWKETRRFTLFMLRDFGMGKIAAEQSIQEEAAQLCARIRHVTDQQGSFDPILILESAVSNIICAMAFGRRFGYDDTEFLGALAAQNSLLAGFSSVYSRILLSPQLSWLAPYLFPETTKTMNRHYGVFTNFVKKIIQEHRETFDGSVNDIIDAFFVEQKKRETDGDDCFTDAQLRYLIQDLFLAGSETTTTTLRWCLLYLVKYPDIQQKIFNELEGVIGRERPPTMGDKKNTPYTEAFMLEIQRFCTIVPLAVAHCTGEDIEFHGYTIPRNTVVLSHLAAIHRDERVFTDPDTFNVERFLNNGCVVNADQVVQFGIGRRVCAGEALARMEMYLFFTKLLLTFRFESADDHIDLKGTKAAICGPKPYRIMALPRDS